jgi:hypothetical protein
VNVAVVASVILMLNHILMMIMIRVNEVLFEVGIVSEGK